MDSAKKKRSRNSSPRTGGSRNGPIVSTDTQQRISVHQQWTAKIVRTALTRADSGYMDTYADLCEAIMTHPRVRSAIRLRVGALQALTLDADHTSNKVVKALRGYYRKSKRLRPASEEDMWIQGDFWRMLPEANMLKMLGWGWIGGMSWVQKRWTWYESVQRWIPRLKPWHLRWFRYSNEDERWYVKVKGQGGVTIEKLIDPTAGEWFLFTPWGEDRPWAEGLWRGLDEAWLAGNYAHTDWARFSGLKGKGLMVGVAPIGAEKEDRDAFTADLARAGELGVITPPNGYDVKQVEVEGKGHDTFKEQLNYLAEIVAIAILGANLLQQVKEGSFAAAQVHQQLFEIGITKSDAETLATALAEDPLAWWLFVNFDDVNAETGPYPRWMKLKDEIAERVAQLDVWSKLGAALKGLQELEATGKLTRAIDYDKILDQYGVPFRDGVSTQDDPPEEDEDLEEPGDDSMDPADEEDEDLDEAA